MRAASAVGRKLISAIVQRDAALRAEEPVDARREAVRDGLAGAAKHGVVGEIMDGSCGRERNGSMPTLRTLKTAPVWPIWAGRGIIRVLLPFPAKRSSSPINLESPWPMRPPTAPQALPRSRQPAAVRAAAHLHQGCELRGPQRPAGVPGAGPARAAQPGPEGRGSGRGRRSSGADRLAHLHPERQERLPGRSAAGRHFHHRGLRRANTDAAGHLRAQLLFPYARQQIADMVQNGGFRLS